MNLWAGLWGDYLDYINWWGRTHLNCGWDHSLLFKVEKVSWACFPCCSPLVLCFFFCGRHELRLTWLPGHEATWTCLPGQTPPPLGYFCQCVLSQLQENTPRQVLRLDGTKFKVRPSIGSSFWPRTRLNPQLCSHHFPEDTCVPSVMGQAQCESYLFPRDFMEPFTESPLQVISKFWATEGQQWVTMLVYPAGTGYLFHTRCSGEH